ncbi:MAG TPA: NADH-quinone oxidoreductase subunit J [Acidisarcina sp.]|nr:NADH-quinone oxidoreductase subunit J [Acidisarcina sp.]
MTLPFAIIAALTIAGAVAAMSLRNLVHCVLALTLAFAGLAGMFLLLGAQFVGFAQVLVYIGSVAILTVFAILLTRGAEPDAFPQLRSAWLPNMVIVAAVFGVLVWAVHASPLSRSALPPQPQVSVKQIGFALMDRFVLPLEVIGLLLTAALIGAVIIAMHEKQASK